MNDAVILAENLTKTFPGNIQAVSALNLSVPRGAVYGLIGRNGAGKTTALRLLMGLLRADSGRAMILDQEMLSASRAHRQRVAYVSQEQQIHAWMTLQELCAYVSHFYDKWDQPYADSLARRFGLATDRQVGLLSGGDRRKAAIVLAMGSRPEALLMDEPAAGLDPVARRELIDALVDALATGDGCTVLFSTHIISDLERVADHVGILDHGRMALCGRLDELQSGMRRVQLVFAGDQPPVGFTLPGATRQQTSGPVVTAIVRGWNDAQAAALAKQYAARVNVFPLGLEDIFIELFGAENKKEFQD